MVVRVELASHQVSGRETDKHVGAGADRRQVRRCIAGFVTLVGFEQMPGDDHALRADEGVGPEGCRFGELHTDRVVIQFDDLDVLVAADRRCGGRRIGGVLPVEDAVVGGERIAVVPVYSLLELPGDRPAVLAEATIVERGNLGREYRHEIAIGVPAGQRFIEQTRGVLVLGADGEVRVEQRGCLPPQHLQGATATAPGRFVGWLFGRHRNPGICQHLRRHRRCQAESDHGSGKRATRQSSTANVVDQTTQALLVHCACLSPRASGEARPAITVPYRRGQMLGSIATQHNRRLMAKNRRALRCQTDYNNVIQI